jgi:hypothetical protein
MRRFRFWRPRRTLLVVTAIAIGLATLVGAFSPSPGMVVQASVVFDDNDDDEDEDEEDREIEGQVVSIDKSKNPPELVVGTIDGEVVVRMLKTDEIDIQGVKVGDYVNIDGEKIHELLFEGTYIERR